MCVCACVYREFSPRRFRGCLLAAPGEAVPAAPAGAARAAAVAAAAPQSMGTPYMLLMYHPATRRRAASLADTCTRHTHTHTRFSQHAYQTVSYV